MNFYPEIYMDGGRASYQEGGAPQPGGQQPGGDPKMQIFQMLQAKGVLGDMTFEQFAQMPPQQIQQMMAQAQGAPQGEDPMAQQGPPQGDPMAGGDPMAQQGGDPMAGGQMPMAAYGGREQWQYGTPENRNIPAGQQPNRLQQNLENKRNAAIASQHMQQNNAANVKSAVYAGQAGQRQLAEDWDTMHNYGNTMMNAQVAQPINNSRNLGNMMQSTRTMQNIQARPTQQTGGRSMYYDGGDYVGEIEPVDAQAEYEYDTMGNEVKPIYSEGKAVGSEPAGGNGNKKKGNGNAGAAGMGMFGMAAGMGSGMLKDNANEKGSAADGSNVASDVGGGALQGASAGAAFGPWGALVGGAAGATMGGVKNLNAQADEADRGRDLAQGTDYGGVGSQLAEYGKRTRRLRNIRLGEQMEVARQKAALGTGKVRTSNAMAQGGGMRNASGGKDAFFNDTKKNPYYHSYNPNYSA